MTNVALTVLFILAVVLYAARPDDEPDTDDSLQRLLERRRCEERQASMSLYGTHDRRVAGAPIEAPGLRRTATGRPSNEEQSHARITE